MRSSTLKILNIEYFFDQMETGRFMKYINDSSKMYELIFADSIKLESIESRSLSICKGCNQMCNNHPEKLYHPAALLIHEAEQVVFP